MATLVETGDRLLTRWERASGGLARVGDRFLAARWWVQVLLVWLAARVFSLAVVLAVARQQGPNPWTTERPGYFAYISGWDAGWYQKIITEGYPKVLPLNAAGHIEPNQWAFYPLFPYLAKGLGALTTLSTEVTAPLIATLASLALALMLYRLFLRFTATGTADPAEASRTALFAVALFVFQMAGPILGFGYAESLSLVMLVGIFLLVDRGRHLSAIPLVLLLAVTRPLQAPLSLTLFCVLLFRWFNRRRVPFPTAEAVRMLALLVVSGVCIAIWPVVVAVSTGDPTAYLKVESAWHDGGVLPGVLWAKIGVRLFGTAFGLLAPVVVVLVTVVALLSRSVRRIGVTMWFWTAAYLLYLVGVSAPNGSIFRLVIPTFGLLLGLSFVSSARAYRVVLLVLFAILQVVWVTWLWQWSGVGPHGAQEANP